ncbi:hypothetical protein RhiirA4_332107, partial [Rhizophagus irregularis]
GVNYLCKIDGNLDAKLYYNILDENFMEMLQYYEFDASDIIFQQDNDLKYSTAILTKQWFGNNNIEVLS